METKPLESADKTSADDEQKDTPDADKQLPSPEEKVEEQEQPSESPSNDVGFKKVFKFVGFKFTVRKDKTEKLEPVQLLNVKSDDTEVTSDGAGDCKEVKVDAVEEAIQNEVSHPVEKAEQETQTEKVKEETSSEKVTESPVELTAESKETEIKSNGNKSPESPTSPLTNETASPLRKFFTQGWAGFRKKTSFRKPKEEEQQVIERDKQEQEKAVAIEETVIKEEDEKEKPAPEKDATELTLEATDEKVKKEIEETKMIDVSTETFQEEAVAPCEQPSPQESTTTVNKESQTFLNDLASEEKLEPVQKSSITLEQSPLESSEGKTELAVPLATEITDEKLDKSELTSPTAIEELEEHFEMVEDISEPKAPLATEIFDERPTEINNVSTVVKKEDTKMNEKEELVLEQLVETDPGIQKGQTPDEQLKVKDALPEVANEQIKQTESSSGDAATSKPPEGITSEIDLFSSQERAKLQGSPLKKLFTGTGLKKLSGKKHKGKREEAKSGEAAEQIQQLSDSAESPEEPKADSSASSPEEATESVEKVIDTAQIMETEEGSTSDMEKKRESVTPWASFKKMVTPKKRVRRLSESDKEEEFEKAKSATLSSTESAPCEEQEDIKEISEEQKLEKTDEPKRKVDTSVSWEALICVGSSKKRARKSSSSDEEVGQRLAQEGQKMDEDGPNKETAPDMTFTSSQESDQGQGNSSPEQAGSPSEGEGVSTWESFKRLVTPRRKSRTKMEDRTEESAVLSSLEHSTSDGDSGKEESWVSFKKLMPGRRKKKSDGIPEHAPVEEAGEEMADTNEEDSDVPAVVPLSEYEAAEQEKFEAQKAVEDITKKETLDQRTEKSEGTLVIEHTNNEGLIHAVTVTVVEGERAVTSIEERSPSWISAAVTESLEYANEDEEKQTEQISGTGVVEETVVVMKLMPEIRKDISGDTIISELEITSEAITAREEASGIEEATEVSCAEETTEMVSAVSRLTESSDTTEIVTPIQEVEECQQNLEELNKQTQEVLQEVAERVKLSDRAQMISESMSEVIQPLSVEKTEQQITATLQESELAKPPLKQEPEKIDFESNEGTGSGQVQDEVQESGLKEVLEKSNDISVDVKEISVETTNFDAANEGKIEQEVVESHEEVTEEQITEEKSEEEEFVIVTVTPEEESEAKFGDTDGKQQACLKAIESEEYSTAFAVHELKMNLEGTTQSETTDSAPEADESVTVKCQEKLQFPLKLEQVDYITPYQEAENTEITAVELKKTPTQNEVKDAGQPLCTEVCVLEAPIQSKTIEGPVQKAITEISDVGKDVALGLEKESIEEVYVQKKDSDVSLDGVKTETHEQKVEPEVELQKLETVISVVNMKSEALQLDTGTKLQGETMEREMPTIKVEVEVHKENVESDAHKQKAETMGHLKEVTEESHLQIMVAKILVEKAEGKVGVEQTTETAKAESFTEKAEVEASTEKAVAEVHAEEAYAKVDVKAHAEKEDAEVTKAKMAVEAPIESVEAEVPAEKMELEVPTRKAEAEASSERADAKVEAEACAEQADAKVEAEASSEQADAKVEAEACTEKAKVEGPTESVEAEVPAEKMELEVPTRKAEAEASSEQADAKVEAEACTEQADAKVEAEACTEKAEVETPTEMADGKMDVETPAQKVDMETYAEKGEAEISKKKIEVNVPAAKVDMADMTEDTEMKSSIEKGEAEALAEKAEVAVPLEKTDAKEGVEAPPEKTSDEAPAKRPGEMVKIEAATKQLEPKEALQNVETELKFQSEKEDMMNSLATDVEIVSVETPIHIDSEQASVESDITVVPVQREAQDIALSLESRHLDNAVSEKPFQSDVQDMAPALEQILTEQVVTEELVGMGLVKASVPYQAAVGVTQNYEEDARLTLELQCKKGFSTEAPESDELGSVTLVESKCTEEIVTRTIVPKEIIILPMKNDTEALQCMGTTVSESLKQIEKECILESKSTDIPVTEHTVKNEATVDSMKNGLESVELAIESKSTETIITGAAKTDVEQDLLVSDSRCSEKVFSNVILENKGESAPTDLKSEGKEAGVNGISVQMDMCPDKSETVHPLSESTADLDCCQKMQVLSEKALTTETKKPTKEVELACGDVLNEAPVQQEVFTMQQDIATFSIPEAHKSSVTITSAALEEQVISENVTSTEISTETLLSLLEKPKETEFKKVQPVSFTHSGLGALGPDTEAVSFSKKVESTVEEPGLSAIRCTEDALIPAHVSDPEVKVQKSDSSKDAKKKVTSPERSPSLTHIEFQKDVVQSVTIESQSTKIVLKIIQNAVDKLEETEEEGPLSKQQSESFETEEDIQADLQLPGESREEKTQEIQPSSIILMQSAQKQKTHKTTEEMPLISDRCEDGEIWSSKKTSADLEAVKCTLQADKQQCAVTTTAQDHGAVNETVKEMKKETGWQKENGEPKLESEVETAISTGTQRATVEGIVSEELAKAPLDLEQPKVKDAEGEQTVQIQEQCIEKQTHIKRKEYHSQSAGFVETLTEKDENNQDCTTCESPQLKSELSES
ncbi:A-kinase anchor protein 12 isoform X1 [Hemicordylus capensis]|nr:A-kinase anchor protein 12 isoform X1 [Hemicordylus capensis]XP_053148421.1 A-kinase anchor protein 12 isoform X1 [Hemicordylus capensis]XP_053148432.1 A-kinase anchor protein 12 isoform X1 [Hemicordylus capensis]XP_053148443.1 A-kinase anchor protein 12 isoform X1 [Hemicordylus capensis]XP_053148453.1 A-kinase anchor protein 12 isoform X1 [Hemicordylus capensis]XP_053148463.1 A-kinase anchor protein 12 isoform X1 [Hemicordylus capensis]